MDLTQLANLGEFIGGVAVLVTLVYLALQVRGNTKALAASTYHAFSTNASEVGFNITANEALVEAVELSIADPDALAPRQIYMLNLLYRSVFRNFENGHHQYLEGFLDGDLWSGYRANLRNQIGDAFIRQWWAGNRYVFSRRFQNFVDAEMKAVGEARTVFDDVFVPTSSPSGASKA